MGERAGDVPKWTFLTNHARVLLAISRDPSVRLREVALTCGVTERTVQAIVADLEEAGYLTRTRAEDGRRNHYALALNTPFRHPAEADHDVAGLIALFTEGSTDDATPQALTNAR
ncbi:helix-turn-helix domain-containing protein [Streptomyces sp. NPDC006464]|uniref:helix-turn-helix transcriptional regulator n=1 Tax=unclassified Streptomyces TaxID=2593676 RepID=UPI0033B8F889